MILSQTALLKRVTEKKKFASNSNPSAVLLPLFWDTYNVAAWGEKTGSDRFCSAFISVKTVFLAFTNKYRENKVMQHLQH